ncbi:hypothetical protein MTR67_040235 [Solanum verrucosum]|uniref:Enoyl reductase (ER) domain-containing protein n=1 Tax=Solanum verrucosum TaxID=315347 RepID=A0AAF0ZRH1_SOLVR|nr:hypothetical protein MTR67_040235 [Solanum verrucosum]
MAGKVMRAVQYDSYGGRAVALKHVEVPVPTPKRDEVLVKVEATSINPIDWKIQKGMLRPLLPTKFPLIPKVGSNVKSFNAGDKVVDMLNVLNGGGLAEYVVANESLTVPRPAEVSAAEGAGLTALQALINPAEVKLDGTGPRKSILASYGCLGWYGSLCCSIGADDVLDYKTPEGAALKSPSGQKYDAVIHCTTGIPWSTFEPNLSSSGKVIDITPGVSAMWTFAIKKLTFSKKQFVPLHLIPKKENLELIVGLLKEGKLKTVIDSKFPLSKAEDAWSKSSDGHATGHLPCMLVQFVIWLFPSIMSFDFVFFAF